MIVEILSRSFSNQPRPPRLTYKALDYDWSATGGPDIARIEATGPEAQLWELRRWLRAPVTVCDDNGRKVWWGLIREVSIDVGGVSAGVSLVDMYNRVRVTYTTDTDEGSTGRKITAWHTDTISAGEYGYKEYEDSMGSLSDEEAESRAAALLERTKYPHQITRPARGRSAARATLECAGWWHTLDWQRFSRASIGMSFLGGSLPRSETLGRSDYTQRVAVSITPSQTFTAGVVKVQLGKIGNPTDSVILSVMADAAGVPGAPVYETAEVLAADIDASMGWVEFVLPTPVTFAVGATYWVELKRSGAYDDANYYTHNNEDDQTIYPGETKRMSYGSWSGPQKWDMLFDITSVSETTEQIQYAVSSKAQFLAGTLVRSNSGIFTPQYRGGDLTTLEEIEALLESGTVNGRRLLATVTPERYLEVREEPARPDRPDYVWSKDGHIREFRSGKIVDHRVPVGVWCEVEGVPTAPGALLFGASAFFIERASYDVEKLTYTPEPKGPKGLYEL